MPKTDHRGQSCSFCGQVFIAHYEADGEGVPVRTRVPCFSDGGEGVIVVAHPRSAYALWIEEF